jgi:hypothetical protein
MFCIIVSKLGYLLFIFWAEKSVLVYRLGFTPRDVAIELHNEKQRTNQRPSTFDSFFKI